MVLALGLTQGTYKPSPDIGGSLAARDVRQPSLEPSTRNINFSGAKFRPPNSDSHVQKLKARDDRCDVEPYNPPPVDMQEFPPFDQRKATVFRYRQQQSVNLGSWCAEIHPSLYIYLIESSVPRFVHEQWMTPSIFACAGGGQISERDIPDGWGNPRSAQAVLERHWDTFINETDFQYLSSIGINTVRLPIGYWNLGPDFVQGTPYADVGQVYVNSWPRVIRAVNMAGRYGIGVLVDLHGAVGSQNGQQHSGISDGTARLFDNPDYIEKTLNVLTFLTKQFAMVSNVVGIQILNEPNNVDSLADFCKSYLIDRSTYSVSWFRYEGHFHYASCRPWRTKFATLLARRLRPRALQPIRGQPYRLRCPGPPFLLRLHTLRPI